MKLGIRRELGLYADSIANYGAPAAVSCISRRALCLAGIHIECGTPHASCAGSKYFFYAWEIPIFVLMGCVGGLSGALWIRINIAMTRLRAQHIPARAVRRRLAEVGS